MNRKLVISRAVLSSALLLSAIAAPSLSSAASASGNTPIIKGEAKQLATLTKASTLEASSVVYSFNNPVELAEQYAPETVPAWKKALEQYEKHVGTAISFHNAGIAVQALPLAEGEVPAFEVTENIDLTKLEEGTSTLTSASASGVQLKSVDLTKAVSAQPIKLDDVKMINAELINISVSQSDEAAVTVTEANDADMSFIRAEIALSKAVQSEDAAAIKQALGALLEQYNVQIAEWEAAATK
ncbi:hypothetical protein [Paenibacillus sp. YIM B09110]|uniref:hypothetical protein n=1 Tax=Paenibacillus sp. YIM B09110 TaxID=3126102 RepID=UPI00301D3D8A